MNDALKVKIVPDEPAQVIGHHLIVLGMTVGTTAILIWLQKKLMEPDFFLTVKMRGLSMAGSYADSRARYWRNVAARTSKMYLECRS